MATYELERDLSSHTTRPLAAGSEGLSEERRDQVLRTLVRNVYKYHNNEIFAVLRNEYTDWEMATKTELAIKRNVYEALSDGLVVSSLMQVLRYHSGLGSGRTYLYHLNYPSHQQQQQQQQSSDSATVEPTSVNDDVPGSFHGDDVFYLLGLSLLRNGSPEETEVSEQLIAYVAGFSYAGDPNEHGAYQDGNGNSGLIFWEPYSPSEQRYLSLGSYPHKAIDLYQKQQIT